MGATPLASVAARTALGLMVIAYGARSFLRNPDWDDDERLWTKAVEACPNSFKTHKSLAFAIYEKDPEGKNIDRVIAEGERPARYRQDANCHAPPRRLLSHQR